jgi:hypothetical protein
MSRTVVRGEGLDPDEHVTADELLRLRAENDALRSRLSRRRTVRTWSSNGLVVLTVVAMIASMVAIWARETLYDTDRFMDVIGPALDDPSFYAALGDVVADGSLQALDLETRVAEVLDQVDAYLADVLVDAIDPDPQVLARLQTFDRPTLSALAPSISVALEDRVVALVDGFVTSDGFRARLPDLARQVHAGGVALITDDRASLPNVYTEDGEVRLDLVPVIAEALQLVAADLQEFLPDVTLPSPIAGAVAQEREQLRSQLAEALETRLPEDFGQLTLMTQSDLAEVQAAAREADRFVWAVAILALLLVGLSIAVSPARRRTIIQLALGVVAGSVLTMLLVRRLEAALLDRIVNTDGRHAVQQAYGELAANLRTLAVLVAVAALVIGIAAYLTGGPAWLSSLNRRWTRLTTATAEGSELARWIVARFEFLRLTGIALALVLVYLIGLELLPILLIGALLGIYLWTITAARHRIAALQPARPVSGVGIEDLPAPGGVMTGTGAGGPETDPERPGDHPLR